MGKAGHSAPTPSTKRQLLFSTPGEDGSNVDETSGFCLIMASLNFYVKISQLLTIGFNLLTYTVQIQ